VSNVRDKACACGSETPAEAQDPSHRSATRWLLLGAGAGAIIPVVFGVTQHWLAGDGSAAGNHASMSHDMTDTSSWLSSPEWYYGAMFAVLLAAAAHSVVRRSTNSCGSTPLGMGVMWGSMLAMALGMAVGVH
jgi:hypothetical protein